MVEMERLAHRGLWTEPSEKNTRGAFERAFEGGFGIETDLRDHGGTVVISHDPPGVGGDPEMTFDAFLKLYRDSGATGTLALNIKADGLAGKILRLLRQYAIDQYFVFDMAIPDMLAYLRCGMRCFSRQSEFETPLIFGENSVETASGRIVQKEIGPTQGIWLDSFSPIWYSPSLVRDHLLSGLDVCLVSPELHGRDPYPWWDEINAFLETAQLPTGQTIGNLMLCTDYPHKF